MTLNFPNESWARSPRCEDEYLKGVNTPFSYPDCPQCKNTLKKIIGDRIITTNPPYFNFKCSNCDFQNFVKLKMKQLNDLPLTT